MRDITGGDLHMCTVMTLTQDIDGKTLRLFSSYSELISEYCPNLCVCVCVCLSALQLKTDSQVIWSFNSGSRIKILWLSLFPK